MIRIKRTIKTPTIIIKKEININKSRLLQFHGVQTSARQVPAGRERVEALFACTAQRLRFLVWKHLAHHRAGILVAMNGKNVESRVGQSYNREPRVFRPDSNGGCQS